MAAFANLFNIEGSCKFRDFLRASYRRHASLEALIYSSNFGIHRTVLQKVLKRWALFHNYNSYLVFFFFSQIGQVVSLGHINLVSRVYHPDRGNEVKEYFHSLAKG